ncbi:MAG: NAD(P)H-hydrate dehydratase [Cyclobacteriaceae bacterium]|nr:NAD(P)H-hydrate dehydratase [Cyclobacteriaceae bacterium]
MLKILPPAQIKALDAYTIKHGAISSIDLMERACRAFTKWFAEHFSELCTVGVVCGTGNNGGDGMGIARMLKELGYPVKVWVVKGSGPESADFKINFDRARNIKIEILPLVNDVDVDEKVFDACEILIDAIFGSGLSRPVEGIYAQVIHCINKAEAKRVAVDIPSGLMTDSPSQDQIVKADFTISFQLPKLAFFLPECHSFVGQWTLVDIGLHKDFIKDADASYFYIIQKDLRKVLRERSTFDHKGNYGHALLIAGSFGKVGAAILAARAALRAGLGLLTVHVPQCGYPILQGSVPEAMVSVDQHEHHLSAVANLDHYTAIGIGPGLGTGPETVAAFVHILENFRSPMVIDADGLNMLSENSALLHLIPEGSILTPHPKEFERLVGGWKNDFERLEKQKMLAAQLKSIIVLKGAYSSIAAPDGRVYFNSTGNPGMATGGSGDVLTGILTGLVAQHYDPLQAAQLGVFVHGLSGDLAVPEMGINSLIASDIIDFLPSAFLRLRKP